MSRFDQLERSLGRFAIPHLTRGLLLGQIIMLIAALSNQSIVASMGFDLKMVLEGEIWRLVTFIFVPPMFDGMLGPLFIFFALYVFWLTGTAVENQIGAVRFNLFVLVSLLWPVLVTSVLTLLTNIPVPSVDNTALITSVFLAFAYLYPDFAFLLFAVLPIKVKYLAYLTWFVLLVGTVGALQQNDWVSALLTATTPMGFFLVFGKHFVQRAQHKQKAMARKSEAIKTQAQPFHICSVCGRTDRTNPELHFRYTDTTDGVTCFCEEHAAPPGS